jgi:DNA repair ATPase RecN
LSRINKTGNVTSVGELVGNNRIEEIARMLSGAEITAEARAAAVSLLDSNHTIDPT